MLLELQAKKIVESSGYQAESATKITEGSAHDNFFITTLDRLMVARFERHSAVYSHGGIRRDPNFNGPLSLTREKNAIDIVRDEAGLPAPKIYGLHESESGPFLLVEHLPGIYWSDYLKTNNFSLTTFLQSLKFLGHDLGKVNKVKFETFGDVLARDEVYPGTITNFADRVQMTIDLKVGRAQEKQALVPQELNETADYFQKELTDLRTSLEVSPKPSLVITDLHPMNFFVDNDGKPSGYFDLESCQAGHPSLTFYDVRRSFFSYFNGVSQWAEDAFLTGFEESGEVYDISNPLNKKLEQVLTTGFLLGVITYYNGVVDGIRDNWSEQYKKIMFNAMHSDRVDYEAIGDVTRSKTGQPIFAN